MMCKSTLPVCPSFLAIARGSLGFCYFPHINQFFPLLPSITPWGFQILLIFLLPLPHEKKSICPLAERVKKIFLQLKSDRRMDRGPQERGKGWAEETKVFNGSPRWGSADKSGERKRVNCWHSIWTLTEESGETRGGGDWKSKVWWKRGQESETDVVGAEGRVKKNEAGNK